MSESNLVQNIAELKKLPTTWIVKDFNNVVSDNSGGNKKLAKTDFLELGEIAIVDQGKELIAGFYNDLNFAVKTKPPYVVFGDHTRIFKYIDFPFVMGADGTKVLQSKDNNCNTKYLYYFFLSINVPETGYNRHFKYLKELQIPLPPLPTQQKIASILDAADALRQKDKALLAKYDELTQSLFLDMFGDPVSNPKGWDMKIMANVCEKISVGFVGVCEPYYTEKQKGIPMIRTGNLGEGFLRYDKMKFVTKEFHLKQKKSQIFKDDILIARHGDNGKAVLYNGEFEEANCLNIIILRPAKGLLNGTYNVNMLNNESTRNSILGKTGGATQKVVNTKEIQKLIVPIPPINLQNQFAERVAIIEQQKELAQASLDKSEELFNSLLQKTFKGELV
jgi:type I restriction enzyme S subunit